MFEHMTEQQAREEILSMTEAYYHQFHQKKKEFQEVV